MVSAEKLFVANRGEIAVRILRAAREIGLRSVQPYSQADEGTLPVRLADERVPLGAKRAQETYLDQEKLIQAAIQSGATLVHPGYGFLAENPEFQGRVVEAGLKFVGPSKDVIQLMAKKDEARAVAEEAGVPVLPGTALDPSLKEMKKFAKEVGYPVLAKAVAGGSGRGMRVVEEESELEERVLEAKREAEAAFSDGGVFIEKYLSSPRHIEIQVFGDGKGNAVHFGERECSIQRRHQKLVEEAPAITLSPKLRENICKAAVALTERVNYFGAGTVEFLVEKEAKASSKFYFLEMNTRIQVEHPVTEEVSGADLVKLQLQLSPGTSELPKQKDIKFRGHSIEYRVYAESPDEDFRPAIGEVKYISRPGGNGVREDGWVEAGTKVSSYYDSLLAKVIVTGSTREEALNRSRQVLSRYIVDGLPTTLGFHRWLLEEKDFLSGDIDVKWLERHYQGQQIEASYVGPLEIPNPGEVSG